MKVKNVKNLNKYLFLSSFAGIGTTAICFYTHDGKIIKIYLNTERKNILFSDNNMIEKLNDLSIIDLNNYVIPNELLIKNNELCAYIMDKVNGPTIKNLSLSTKVREIASSIPELLKSTKIVSEQGFELNDLHDRNIMYDGNIKIIDLDQTVKRSDLSSDKLMDKNMLHLIEIITKSLFKVRSYYDIVFYDNKLNDLYTNAIFREYESYIDFYSKLIEIYGEEVNIKKLKKVNDDILYKVDRVKLGYR